MLNLNDDTIKTEGGSFDPSKIFGYEIVDNNVIKTTVENVVISGFGTIETTTTGNKYWDIKFKDTKGNETNYREFDIDMTRDGWEKKQKSQLSRLKHVLTKFVPEGTNLPNCSTFPELWAAVQALLIANQCNTKPFRLKMIYNDKGFLTIPAYVPFMESMTVAKEQSGLKLTDFDTLVRPSADKPAAPSAAATTVDIPFKFG